MNEFPNEDKLMMALLPPPPPAAVRDVVMGEFSTGGDSGGEFNPALQVVVLLSVRSPASQTISQSISYFLLIRLLSVDCRVSLRLIWSFHPSSGRLPTIKREKKKLPIWGLMSRSRGDSAEDPADDDPRLSFASPGLWWPSLPLSDEEVFCWVSLSCFLNFARLFWNQT